MAIITGVRMPRRIFGKINNMEKDQNIIQKNKLILNGNKIKAKYTILPALTIPH